MAKRNWIIDADDYESEEHFREAVAAELASFELIGHRIGLALTAGPIREKVGQTVVTRGWVFETAAVPLAGQPRPVQRPQPEPVVEEPEPVVEFPGEVTVEDGDEKVKVRVVNDKYAEAA